MVLFIMLLLSPVIFSILVFCFIVEKKEIQKRYREEQLFVQNNIGKILYQYYPTRNDLRGVAKISKPITRKNSNGLKEFLEEHGKQFVIYMEKKPAFSIPVSCCKDVKEELLEWLNKQPNVNYAICENDMIHVRMRGDADL